MTAHSIRLRGPWDYEPIERYDGRPLPPVGRSTVPSDWRETLGQPFAGRVRHTRRFNCPTGLEADDQVWLVIERVAGRAQVTLNDRPLADAVGESGGSFEITSLLTPANRLVLDISGRADDETPAGPTGEVRLEIRQAV